MKTVIKSTDAPQAIGPYSQAIIAGNIVFTAGQIHLTESGTLLKGTIEEKTHQVMKNLAAILKAADATFVDVVKTTVYITDSAVFKKVNEIYTTYVKEPYPARETVVVKELPMGAEIEISMIAVKKCCCCDQGGECSC